MKELKYIDIIKNTLSDNHYIGNDCADLREMGVYLTQDTLVEGVHFDLRTTTPYQLGQKVVAVNISDLATSICNPAYISISLSLPENFSEDFVRGFYQGVNDACQKYYVKVAGGDLTRADKVIISVAALGGQRHCLKVSREFAHAGEYIVSTGFYGSSAAGLYALKKGIQVSEEIINAHLMPVARIAEAHEIGSYTNLDLCIMDTSDGLADALYKIAKASNVSIKINFDDIPVLPEVKEFAIKENIDIKDWVLWGGEDYELVFVVPYYLFASLDLTRFKYIGCTYEPDGIPLEVSQGSEKIYITDEVFNLKAYNHFGG